MQLQYSTKTLRVLLYFFMFLIVGGTLALYVLPQWSNVIEQCPVYGTVTIAYAGVSIVLCLLIAQLCADVADRVYNQLSRFGKPEPKLEHAIIVTAVGIVTLCGILFQNFYLTYMPLVGLVIYLLMSRENRTYLSHVWLREFLFMVTSVTFGSIVAPITPIIFAVLAGLYTGRTRIATIFSICYAIVLAVAVIKLANLGVSPIAVLVPGFAYLTQFADVASLQFTVSNVNVPTAITKVFQFMVTNSYIAFLEELIGRATIPFAGPVLPTALFVSLHIPTRVGVFFSPGFVSASVPEYAIVQVVSTLTLIAIATIFLVRTYAMAGLVPSMLLHMLYDTYIDTLAIGQIVAVTLLFIVLVIYLVLVGLRSLMGGEEEPHQIIVID